MLQMSKPFPLNTKTQPKCVKNVLKMLSFVSERSEDPYGSPGDWACILKTPNLI